MFESAPGAVFLSYAREDAAPARRIAEALRSHGIDVWFDENELRGGEAWDQRIRRQIRDCTLFIPVISAHTQSRGEGYFRLEWHLAVERMRLMIEGMPFLVPVVVDDTPESSDMVPESFQRVHWMRLPGALPTPHFVDQIDRLLQAPRRPVFAPAPGEARTGHPARALSPRWRTVVAGGVLSALALGGYFILRSMTHPRPAARPSLGGELEPPAPAGPEKSIAVLPFENLGDEQDGAFADGVHDQILTSLTCIRELRVTSQTSVMAYRSKPENVRDIARKLGVAFILEGTVRRAAGKVRVTAQLIRAASDEHVWAKDYTADLTASEMFAIQSDLAEKIATSLEAALSPKERTLLAQHPTDNTAAYEQYARARANRRASATNSTSALTQQERLLARAVELDPRFAAAWSELAIVHTTLYGMRDRTAARLAQAKDAMDHALALAPGAPDVIRAHAEYLSRGFRDHSAAATQYRQLLLLQPNEPAAHLGLALVQLRLAQWPGARESFGRALQLDPDDLQAAESLYAFQVATRHYREARETARRLVEMRPREMTFAYELARTGFLESGSTREMEAFFATHDVRTARSRQLATFHRRWRDVLGESSESGDKASDDDASTVFETAVRLAAQGRISEARAALSPLLQDLTRRVSLSPELESAWARLMQVQALLGNTTEAQRAAERAVALLPESRDAVAGPAVGQAVAFVHAWTGDKDRAMAEYARLLQVPYSGLNVHEMRRNALFAPLRGDARFDALLRDPRNNAPLGDALSASGMVGAGLARRMPVLLVARDDARRVDFMVPNEVGVMQRLLEEAGYRVIIASVSGQPIKGETTILRPELRLADANVDDYAGFLFPCMMPGVQYPCARELSGFARKAVATGKPVAAQTSGVGTLADAGVMDGKRYAMLRDEHPGYVTGGIWAGEGVVKDGNIITSAVCPNLANETGRSEGTAELMRRFIQALGNGAKD